MTFSELWQHLQALCAPERRCRSLASPKAPRTSMAAGSGSRPGDAVSFVFRGGKRVHGIIQRRGRKNFHVLGENGTLYAVPFHLARRENGATPRVKATQPILPVQNVVPLIVAECRRLLRTSGIEIHVRYKRHVWATHFRAERHLQFGERCIAYQLTPAKPIDNVGANLRRYGLKMDSPSRLAMLILHEVSHAIAHHRYGPRIRPHGRQFYTVLSELVESEFDDLRRLFRNHISHATA